jgi:NAD(P)H-hydrate epimerase
MQKIDYDTIHDFGLPGQVLMENAGVMVVRQIMWRNMPRIDNVRVAVFCGPGNNGGDGFVISRHLFSQGISCDTFTFGEDDSYQGDALENLKILRNFGAPVSRISSADDVAGIEGYDIILDAIFGTGLVRDVEGVYADIVDLINQSGGEVYSVDIPSGICSDTGRILGKAVRADVTVTFGLAKIGHFVPPGIDHTGDLNVSHISFPPELRNSLNIKAEVIDQKDIRQRIPRRNTEQHKGNNGHLLMFAGQKGTTGAATLATTAAFRAGSGLVTLATDSFSASLVQKIRPEVMTCDLSETSVEESIKGKNVIAFGPGFGVNPGALENLRFLSENTRLPLVIDADGITLLAENKEILESLKNRPVVLTPHPGEMARLLACSTEEVQANRIELAREFATRNQVFLVLKGAATVVAGPDGRIALNPTGSPAMGTAGMGDVLTGILASLIGQGLETWDAIRFGVFLHGLSADLVSRRRGERGMMAGDVAENLPDTMRSLLEI